VVGDARPADFAVCRYEFPIVQNPTRRCVFWTIRWNLRSEVLKSFVSNFVPFIFHVESEWPLTGSFGGKVWFLSDFSCWQVFGG